MALENLVGPDIFVDNLVRTNPAIDDPVSQGCDHLRGIKNALLNSFPNITGAVTVTQEQLNAVVALAARPILGTTLANVTASRALNANYTNGTANVMTVVVSGNTFGTSGNVSAISDGVIVSTQPWTLTDGNYPYSVTFLVAPGKVYRVNGIAGLSTWAEYT